MEKLRIAFILDTMSIGGIPKALIPYMEELVKCADVTLILENSKGELQDKVPSQVYQIVIPRRGLEGGLRNDASRGSILSCATLFLLNLWNGHVTKRWVKNNSLIAEHNGQLIDEIFDCAIAFHGMNISNIVRTIYNVNATVKIAWIHGDHPFTDKHKEDVSELYQKFDYIFFDSLICEKNFLKDFPEVKGKAVVSHPMINENEILALSKEATDAPLESGYLSILTVGRISEEKGQDMIPEIIMKLRGLDIPFRWYLVGDGPDTDRIKALARDKNCNELIFCGSKKNPYPYIAACDIYVQPSYSEAYSITAFEAATLGKAIVITNVAGATELLRADEDAVVVAPTVEEIGAGIQKLMLDKQFASKLRKNVRDRDYSNKNEANKLIEGLKKGTFTKTP